MEGLKGADRSGKHGDVSTGRSERSERLKGATSRATRAVWGFQAVCGFVSKSSESKNRHPTTASRSPIRTEVDEVPEDREAGFATFLGVELGAEDGAGVVGDDRGEVDLVVGRGHDGVLVVGVGVV